jgi:hypothetical protein
MCGVSFREIKVMIAPIVAITRIDMAGSGRFNAGKYSYQALFYCTPPNVIMVPIKEWAAENFYTVRQCRALLRRRYLVGMKHRGRMYVAKNPAAE